MQPLSNAKLKQFAALGRKKERLEAGLYMVEGEKLCVEAIRSRQPIVALIATADLWQAYPGWLGYPAEAYTATPDQLGRISTQAQPEGDIAILALPAPPEHLPLQAPAMLLHNIADPGNLGALLRTAAWYGFGALFTTPESVEATNPKVVRASMGAAFHVPVIQLADFDAFVASHAARISAAFLGAEPLMGSIPIGRDWLLLGSESHGLPASYRALTDLFCFTLPHGPGGQGESLNLAATGAVLADRLVRQL